MVFSFVAPWKAMSKDALCSRGFLSTICQTFAADGPSFAPFDPIENLKNLATLQLLDEVRERVRRRLKDSAASLGCPASSEYPLADVMSLLLEEMVLCFNASSGRGR